MSSGSSSVRSWRLFWVCLSVFAAHLCVNLFLPKERVLLPSGILLLAETLGANLACLWRARRVEAAARTLWMLLATAELILFITRFEVGIEYVFLHFPHNITAPSDFLAFLWVLPVILASGAPTETRPLRLFYWLDGIQIALIILFFYVMTNGELPLTEIQQNPFSGYHTIHLEWLGQGLMALMALLRWQTKPADLRQHLFWKNASLFLCVDLLVEPLYNIINLYSAEQPVRLQFIMAMPLLLLVMLALRPLPLNPPSVRTTRQRDLALLIDNASPVLYPVVAVSLAIAFAHLHLRLSLTAIAISLLAYGTRTTVLQMRLYRMQIKMEKTQEKLEQLTLIDPLTGIGNRRDFDRHLKNAWRKSQEGNKSFALLIVDVDFFKILNDVYGHTEGDHCLRSIACALQSVFRNDEDRVTRFGGEEFAAIVLGENRTVALSIAERMLRAVAALELRTETPLGNHVTVSIGLSLSNQAHSAAELLQKADAALYKAKRLGRNRVVAL